MKNSRWQKIVAYSMALPSSILGFVFLLNKIAESGLISKKTASIIIVLFLFQILFMLTWYGRTKK